MATSDGAFDPSQPLHNTRHERFVRNVLAGMSQTQAYIEAGYSERGARNNAHRLIAKNDVTQRMVYLKEQSLAADIMSANEALVEMSHLARNASDREKIVALNSIMKYHGLFKDNLDITTKGEALPQVQIYIPDNGRDE